eukprot:CAMPEP_0116120124 /NCGR_PEP_ID=MMETSP0329-20121206/3012_1 /TAXON_ID=697910 /ORGANISM="Pseudo-nitzschia arenysensis, Strain B593" /LENGTH=165 /DNA_ID=CAMNT_0003613881 /DNA_START=28 /DNA_END=522 /DNA_ORIENTATION=-
MVVGTTVQESVAAAIGMEPVEMTHAVSGMMLRQFFDTSGLPDFFPVDRDEIMEYLQAVHDIGNFETKYPWASMHLDLENRVDQYLSLRGMGPHRLNKDTTKLITCEAATRIMDRTDYVPHFILAGLFLYRAGVYGRKEDVERLAIEYSHIEDSSSEEEYSDDEIE